MSSKLFLQESPNNLEELVIYHVKSFTKMSNLNNTHIDYILDMYRSMDPKTFAPYKIQQIGPALGKVLGTKLLEMIKTEQEIERYQVQNSMSDYQIAMLGNANEVEETDRYQLEEKTVLPYATDIAIEDFMGINNITDLKLMYNPDSMLVHYYLVLDSNYRNTSLEDPANIKKFTWNYTATQNILEPGFCNSASVIRDIIGMRLYQPRVPYVSSMNGSAKRVSLLIEEFKAQSFICENGTRFHYLLRPDIYNAGTSIELTTEDYNDAVFNFRKPITTFDTITLSFADPTNPITFTTPFDRFVVALEFICYKSDK